MFFKKTKMKILEKTWLVFLVAISVALIYPGFSSYLEPYLTFLLILLMSFSTRDINLRELFNKKMLKNAFFMAVFNYLILSTITILAGLLVSKEYFPGFVIMAAVPCAIAVIPYTNLLHGNKHASTAGLIMTYIFSLILTPLIIYLFFRQSVDVKVLIEKILLLVILPLILAQFIKKFNHKLHNHDKSITNLIFLVLMYGMIGLNQDIIINKFLSLKFVLLALFIRTFVISTIVYFLTKKKKKLGISYTIFASFKNLGYATILSLALFGKAASLPATLGIIFETITFVWLERLVIFNEARISK